jgi:hypothetical protein
MPTFKSAAAERERHPRSRDLRMKLDAEKPETLEDLARHFIEGKDRIAYLDNALIEADKEARKLEDIAKENAFKADIARKKARDIGADLLKQKHAITDVEKRMRALAQKKR